ncbi:MAG: hypothetical protein F6K08_29265, partial [Okeania sp. SIO1H6]|nr:hypothetical protein [Okeania sp. SIO1H6]
MVQKTRTELQELFKTGAKPSQQDFTDFIESTLNRMDDGIEKPSGAGVPLKIMAQGDDEKLLDFYRSKTKTWSISQKSGDEEGLNISNSSGESKLFIDSSSGNVGIGTTTPEAKLSVNGDLQVDILTVNQLAINKVKDDDDIEDTHKLKIYGGDLVFKVADNANNQGILFQNSGGHYTWRIYRTIDSADTYPSLRIAGGGSSSITDLQDAMTIFHDGNVGIGTTSPGAKLEVNGDIKVEGKFIGNLKIKDTR